VAGCPGAAPARLHGRHAPRAELIGVGMPMGIKVNPLRHIIESALVSFPGPSQIGLRILDSRECIGHGHSRGLPDVELASGSCVWVALPGQKGFEHTTSSFVSFILGVCSYDFLLNYRNHKKTLPLSIKTIIYVSTTGARRPTNKHRSTRK